MRVTFFILLFFFFSLNTSLHFSRSPNVFSLPLSPVCYSYMRLIFISREHIWKFSVADRLAVLISALSHNPLLARESRVLYVRAPKAPSRVHIVHYYLSSRASRLRSVREMGMVLLIVESRKRFRAAHRALRSRAHLRTHLSSLSLCEFTPKRYNDIDSRLIIRFIHVDCAQQDEFERSSRDATPRNATFFLAEKLETN